MTAMATSTDAHASANDAAPAPALAGGVAPLSSFQPLLLAHSLRLAHRHGSSSAAARWMRGSVVRLDHGSGSSNSDVPVGHEGDAVLGLLHPPARGRPPNRVRDSTGLRLHRPEQAPFAVVAVLGSRDSGLHCCGGLVEPSDTPPATPSSAASAASAPWPSPSPSSASPIHAECVSLRPGTRLAWLGEEGGLVGHLFSDAPANVVLGVRDPSEDVFEDADAAAGESSRGAQVQEQQQQQQRAAELEFVAQACVFEVVGRVYDAATARPVNIRSLCPPIPRSLPLPPASHVDSGSAALSQPYPPPRLLLVGGTSSSCGKTSLICTLIQSLHSLAHSAGLDPPRLAYVKLTGCGGARDLARVRALKNSAGQPAVTLAFDHVDVGLPSTHSPSLSLPWDGHGRTDGDSDADGQDRGPWPSRMERAMSELIWLASQPCAGPPLAAHALPSRRGSLVTPHPHPHAPAQTQTQAQGQGQGQGLGQGMPSAAASSSSQARPADFILCELGSDLVGAGNPIVLSHPALGLGLGAGLGPGLGPAAATGAGSAAPAPPRLLGLCVLAENALAVLGSSAFLGTLGFPPEAVHYFAGARCNPQGLGSRLEGSGVVLRDTSPAAVAGAVREMMERSSSAAAAAQSEAAWSQHHSVSATPPPHAPHSLGDAHAHAHAHTGGTSSSTGAGAVPAWPSSFSPEATSHSQPHQQGLEGPDPSAESLAAAAESLAWFERSFVPLPLPVPSSPADDDSAPVKPEQRALCRELVEWTLQSSSLPASPPPQQLDAGLSGSGGVVESWWSERDVLVLVRRLSRSERLQRALSFLWQVRRRDKLRAKRALEAAEAARNAVEHSLGMLANAKKTAPAAATAKSAGPTTPATPGTPGQAGGSAATVALLLSLPDYAHSPYALPAAPHSLSPPASAPAALLGCDSALAALRRASVPARVSEDAFWSCYFTHLFDELQAYLAHRRGDFAPSPVE